VVEAEKTGRLGKTKGQFKIGKAKSKRVGENQPQQVQFNDPLY
jgi:hypothetical protein